MRERPGVPKGTWAILAAGGMGIRLGQATPKQFREIGGKPLYSFALGSFLAAGVRGVVVVVPQAWMGAVRRSVPTQAGSMIVVCQGGARRRDSVAAGLRHIPGEARVVVVHDAARPFLPLSVLRAVAWAAAESSASLAVLPVVDTLKRSSSGTTVERTVDRSVLYRAQTPQAFSRKLLQRVLDAPEIEGALPTDEAVGAELLGVPPCMVKGSVFCFKITTQDDLDMARALAPWLTARRNEDEDWSWL